MVRRKEIEYKETEVFDVFPEFEYTKRQKSRVVLFHDYANHFQRIIRYAAHFDKWYPNKIMLVYIVGQPKPERIMKELENAGCSDRLCVLTSNFPDEKMELYKQFDSVRKSLINVGVWDKDTQSPKQTYLDEHKQRKQLLRKFPDLEKDLADLISETEKELEIVHQYHRLVKASKNTYFKKFTCYRIGHLSKPFLHEKLDLLITKIFPYGPEALGINDYSILALAGVKHGINQVEEGRSNPKLGFFPNDETPVVRFIRRTVNKALEEKGYCKLKDLSELVRQSPYGLDYNGYGAACVAYAVSAYNDRSLLLFDGCNDFYVKENLEVIVDIMLSPRYTQYILTHPSMDRGYCIYLESHPHKVVKQITSKVFGVPVRMPGATMFTYLRTKLENEIRLPLSETDERLYNIVSMRVPWYDKNAVDGLRRSLEGNEEELCSLVKLHYTKDAAMSDAERRKYSQCASWLWSAGELER